MPGGMRHLTTEKLTAMQSLEQMARITAVVLLLAAVLVFWKGKVFASIEYLTGKKKRKGTDKIKYDIKSRLNVVILLIFAAGYPCMVQASQGDFTEMKLEVNSREPFEKEEEYTKTLFYNQDVSLFFQVHGEKEEFQKQMEGLYLYENISQSPELVIAPEDFEENTDENHMFQKEVCLKAEKDEEKRIKILLKGKPESKWIFYSSNIMENSYGKIYDNIFESKDIVIDKKAPCIYEEICLEPLEQKKVYEGLDYYNNGVRGSIWMEEKYFCNSGVSLNAVPLDKTAELSVTNSEYSTTENTIEIQGWRVQQTDKQKRQITFQFREEGKWRLEFTCRDAAGNKSVVYGDSSKQKAESNEFIIDRSAPQIEVNYDKFVKINAQKTDYLKVNEAVERDIGAIKSSNCEGIANEAVTVSVRIRETRFDPEKVILRIEEESYGSGNAKEVTGQYLKAEKKCKKEKEDVYLLQWSFSEDGHYRFFLEYTDRAGNKLEAGKNGEVKSCLRQGQYRSPYCTIDKKPPRVKMFRYGGKPRKYVDNRPYFQEETEVEIVVEEENFNPGNIFVGDVREYADSTMKKDKNMLSSELMWTSSYEKGNRINRTSFPVRQEGNYTFTLMLKDEAGNLAKVEKGKCTYDCTIPEIIYESNNKSGDVIIDAADKYGKDDVQLKNYDSFHYFGKKYLEITITARDRISGIDKIYYYFTNEKGQKIKEEVTEKIINQSGTFENRIRIRLKKKNFKGRLHIYAVDKCGLKSKMIACKGMISESEKLHKKISEIRMKLPEAVYEDKKQKILYYKSDVRLQVMSADEYSGISRMYIRAVTKCGDKPYKIERCYDEKKRVTCFGRIKGILKAESFADSCMENPVRIRCGMEDNAGNKSVRGYSGYKIVIDDDKPQINVDYNVEKKGKQYYNTVRIARVRVKDKNFNPEAVRWEISGRKDGYQIGTWKRSGDMWECQIRFFRDGSGYKIRLTASDYAGNQAAWDKDVGFTLDMTPPYAAMIMKQSDSRNGQYYKTGREVIFRIRDRNFSWKNVRIEVKRKENNKEEKLHLSGQSVSKKDEHRLKVYLEKEGQYLIRFFCRDLAGNKAPAVRPLRFVIDKTVPDVVISGVKNGMAYAEKIAPEVIVKDNNLDSGKCRIEIKKEEGNTEKKRLSPAVTKKMKNGISVKWDDFLQRKECDGKYILKVNARDYAGNKAVIVKRFTVDRFGAEYVIPDSTRALMKKYYIRKEEDICIEERCVNKADTKIVVWKDNQDRKELSETGQLLTVGEKNRPEYEVKSVRDENGWSRKNYRIYKENFCREGVYRIVLESSDYVISNKKKKIIRETTNEIKGEPVTFVVDKTAPIIKISGLEQKFYDKKRHKFAVTAMDGNGLAYVKVTIHYENGKRADRCIMLKETDFGDKHTAQIALEEYQGYQTVFCEAQDVAGNVSYVGEKGVTTCLVSENRAVRTYYRYPSVVCAVFGGILTGVVLVLRRKNKKGVLTEK